MTEVLIGLAGVIVGAGISWLREWSTTQSQKKRRGEYLAASIVCTLDEYSNRCVEVINDNGTSYGQASKRDEQGQDLFIPITKLPEIPSYPNDIDWKSIDPILMYRILSFSNKIREVNDWIAFSGNELAYPPYYEELYEARHVGYATLGLEAIAISEELRKSYSLPTRKSVFDKEWDPKSYLEDKLRKIKAQKTLR